MNKLSRQGQTNLIIILSGMLFMSIALFNIALNNANNRADRAEQTIERLTEYTDRKSGGTSLLTGSNINYDLRTFDGGLTWYAVERNNDWGFKIIGDSEEVYPGLLDHIEAMDRLTQHVQTNGAIDLSNLDNIKLLEDAGFEVKRK